MFRLFRRLLKLDVVTSESANPVQCKRDLKGWFKLNYDNVGDAWIAPCASAQHVWGTWIPEPSVNNKLKRREGSGSTGGFFD
jgi:hypothetical protein